MGDDDDIYDVFLVLKPFRELAPTMPTRLALVHDLEHRLLLTAEGYYAPRLDSALIDLQFRRSKVADLGEKTLLKEIARLRLPIIVPDELSFEKRCDFFLDHLGLYTTYVQQFRGLLGEGGMIESTITNLAAQQGLPMGIPSGPSGPHPALQAPRWDRAETVSVQ